MRKIFICFVALVFFWLLGAGNVLALTKTSGDLELTYGSDPLFPSSTIWYPGLSVTEQFTVKNLGGSTHTVFVQTTDESQTGNLADKLSVDLGGFSGTMKGFWDAGQINLSDLSAGSSHTYDMAVGFDPSAGNDFQNKTAGFDLVVGFVGTEDQLHIGGVGGASTGPAVCNDAKPGSAPTITSAVAGTNSVTLYWDPAGNPVTYYLITYGMEPGAQTFGNPYVGDGKTTSYTVEGLSGGVTYYFRVRAGNGCMPGDFSGEVSATPGGEVLAGPAEGFAPGVLGEQENLNTGVSTEAAEIRDVKGEATAACLNCFWWPLLVIQALVLLALRKKKWLWAVVVSGLIYLAFLYINRACLAAGICRYFLLLDLGVLVLVRLFGKRFMAWVAKMAK